MRGFAGAHLRRVPSNLPGFSGASRRRLAKRAQAEPHWPSVAQTRAALASMRVRFVALAQVQRAVRLAAAVSPECPRAGARRVHHRRTFLPTSAQHLWQSLRGS